MQLQWFTFSSWALCGMDACGLIRFPLKGLKACLSFWFLMYFLMDLAVCLYALIRNGIAIEFSQFPFRRFRKNKQKGKDDFPLFFQSSLNSLQCENGGIHSIEATIADSSFVQNQISQKLYALARWVSFYEHVPAHRFLCCMVWDLGSITNYF